MCHLKRIDGFARTSAPGTRRNRQERAAQLTLHEEKKRFVADWIATHGSDEQKTRHAAGVLPIREAVEAMTDQVFAPVGDRPRYTRDGVARLRSIWRSSQTTGANRSPHRT